MRTSINVLAVFLLVSLHVPGYAANYAETITVGKSGADFTSPTTAVASITTATAATPVLVKIQSGTYDLGKSMLQLKAYVDIEGEGADKTILSSTITNVDGETCSVGTVNMATNSTLKNLRVDNNSQGNHVSGLIAGVVFDNVTASADNIKINVGADNTVAPRSYGICSVGAAADAKLNNVTVMARNKGPVVAVAILKDSSMNISGAHLAVVAKHAGMTRIIDCTNGSSMNGNLSIVKSWLEGTVLAENGSNLGLDVNDCSVTVVETTIKLSGGDDNVGVIARSRPVTIDKSKIFSSGKAILNEGTEMVTVSNSVVHGELPPEAKLRLSNNTDGQGMPIADQ